jgi:predicted Zn-dependent protease
MSPLAAGFPTFKARNFQIRMTLADRPIAARSRRPSRPMAVAISLAVVASHWIAAASPAQAQRRGGGPPIVRDAEVEQLMREYTQPILKTAGLAQQNVQVVIINSRAFNAFVADGRRIFVNAGTIMEAETPNQVIGVLAHETAHIAGGHLSRLREQLQAATTQSIIALILGAGAMVAA